MEQHTNLIVSIVGGLIALLVRLYANNQQLKNITDTLKAQIEVREAMRIITSTTPISRVLFLEMRNGAEKVVDGVFKNYRVSVIDECHKDGVTSIKAGYQNIFVDLQYQQMIQSAWLEHYVDYDVATMPECDLKTIYEGEGVKYSRVYTVFVNKKNKVVNFLSVATYQDSFFDDKEVNKVLERQINLIIEKYEFIYG